MITSAVLLGTLFACIAFYGVHPTSPDLDPWKYLAAGERLNAGHPLYALGPGDRPVLLVPPYWSVPLLSPPLIAVLWRPLALLGDAAMILWWAGGMAAMIAFVAWSTRAAGAVGLLVLIVLSPALWLTALSGNATTWLIPLLALRHPLAVALAAAVKLSPILLAPSAGWRACLAGVAGLAVVSLAGAGLQNHLDWFATVPQSAPTPLSVAALTGLPPSVVFVGMGLLALKGWRWAVVAMTFATPVVYFSTLSLLALAVPRDRTEPHP